MSTEVNEATFQALGNSSALVRERALLSLERAVRADAGDHQVNWIQYLQPLWTSALWHERLGGLSGSKAVLSSQRDDLLEQQLQEVSQRLLADEEPRVRIAAGECLGLLAKFRGLSVWTDCRKALLDSIHQDYDRDAASAKAPATNPEQVDIASSQDGGLNQAPLQLPRKQQHRSPPATGSIKQDHRAVKGEADAETLPDYLSTLLQAANQAVPPGKGEMRHGTEGWRCLETSFKAMLQIMENSGSEFCNYVDAPLMQLVLKSLHHPNRFVRETCYQITALICNILSGSALQPHALSIAQHLRDGLSENWSQVRFAACVATRAFMQGCEGFRDNFFPLLLPHMCLNRYDVAEGVRTYSQATWVSVLGQEGRSWLGKCFPQVLDHYTMQAKTNNPAVREAACTCLAEAASKIDAAIVEPHLQRIMSTLLACFRDDAWPVRSAACRGCGRVVGALPECSKPYLPDLWPLWIAHTDDNIPSVREDAAIALGDAALGLHQDALSIILPHLRASLPAAHQQLIDSSSPRVLAAAPNGPATKPAEGLASNAASITAWPGVHPPTLLPTMPAQPSSNGLHPQQSDAPPAAPLPPLKTAQQPGAGEVQEPLSPSAARAASVVNWPLSGSVSRDGKPSNGGDAESLFGSAGPLVRPKRTGGVDYSCGCMDYGVRRPKEPWEASDGAVYLMREVAKVASGEVALLLPQLASIAALDGFAGCRHLQETIWRQLPSIAASVGKRPFKPHLEAFLPLLFAGLASGHQLSEAAAGNCLGQLRDWLGPNIFASRLSPDQQSLMLNRLVPPPALRG